jgi:3-hydroxyisobutyrate dehydrogenase-like beta-hydroxyacid dehydrogenase
MSVKIDKSTARLGFAGLGLMGSRLARRLHNAGWQVKGWNRSREAAQAVAEQGIALAESVAALTSDSDVILSSLANDAAVRAVYFDPAGIFASAKAGTILLEMSTISAELSQELHRAAAARQLHLIDLPVSGSTPAVDAGTITLFAGGDPTIFAQCTPIFESIASQWFLIGPGSSGTMMKLVVNLLLGLNMQSIAEAISFGEHLRIEKETLLHVLSKTAVIAPAMMGKFEKIKNEDYSPQFPLRLMSKDLNLVMDAAKQSGAHLPAGQVAQQVFAANVPTQGDLDLSAIAPYVKNLKA